MAKQLIGGRLVDVPGMGGTQTVAEHREETEKIRAGTIIPRQKLRKGMRVRAPAYVLDDGRKQSWDSYWGHDVNGVPTELTVARVDHEEGEIELREDASRGGATVDPNIGDLPLMFELVKKPRKR